MFSALPTNLAQTVEGTCLLGLWYAVRVRTCLRRWACVERRLIRSADAAAWLCHQPTLGPRERATRLHIRSIGALRLIALQGRLVRAKQQADRWRRRLSVATGGPGAGNSPGDTSQAGAGTSTSTSSGSGSGTMATSVAVGAGPADDSSSALLALSEDLCREVLADLDVIADASHIGEDMAAAVAHLTDNGARGRREGVAAAEWTADPVCRGVWVCSRWGPSPAVHASVLRLLPAAAPAVPTLLSSIKDVADYTDAYLDAFDQHRKAVAAAPSPSV